jgi:4-hydroxy-3-polyprenylbenzoate decarboxylase
MGYSLRDWVALLKEKGELVEVDEEIDWKYEAYSWAQMTGRVSGPALLFNKVKGVKEGYRLMTASYAGNIRRPSRRCAMCLGIDPNLEWLQVNREIMRRMGTPLKPVEVATGPVKEVIEMGAEVNLLDFPFPLQTIGDGGRYLLQNVVIVKDPDSDWTNWGDYSCMVSGRRGFATTALGGFAAIYYGKYESRGQSMPVAIAVGGDPAMGLLAGTPMPAGVSEADIAGGLRGMPMELVKAETSDMLVPADAEIVFEGECRPYERAWESPRPEIYNFAAGPRALTFAIRIHCVTHRKDPIIHFCAHTSNSMTDNESILATMYPPALDMTAMMFGMPIKQANFTMVRSGGWGFAISTRDWYPGFVRATADLLFAMPQTSYIDEIRLFDDDINLTRPEQIIEALYTQRNPLRDMWRTDARETPTCVVCRAYWEREDLEREFAMVNALSGNICSNCLTKDEPPLGVRRTCFETLIPEETQKWVMDNWQKLGFEEEPFWNKPFLDLPPSLVPPPL